MSLQDRQSFLDQLREKYKLQAASVFTISGRNQVFITVLIGGLDAQNPKAFMDYVVSEYVQSRMYNEYVDVFGDNPWLRIIIEDINDLIN